MSRSREVHVIFVDLHGQNLSCRIFRPFPTLFRRPTIQVFAYRELVTPTLLTWATELVDRGVLRGGFARFLWGLTEQITEGVDGSHEMEPTKFEEILEGVGVTIPLPELRASMPVDESADSSTPAASETKARGNDDAGSRGDGVDLLVIMRLPLEADAETRENLSLARRAALNPRDSSGGRSISLKAVFEFDHAGAPHGLPERVMALSHKIGTFSPAARWRLGGLFLLHDNDVGAASSIILEYDKRRKVFCIEALGQTTEDIRAVQFVVSALFHVARDFPGASWTGWVGCGMGHDGEKMYHLATSHDKQVRMSFALAVLSYTKYTTSSLIALLTVARTTTTFKRSRRRSTYSSTFFLRRFPFKSALVLYLLDYWRICECRHHLLKALLPYNVHRD